MKRLLLLICLCLIAPLAGAQSIIDHAVASQRRIYLVYSDVDAKLLAARIRNLILDHPSFQQGNERIVLASKDEVATLGNDPRFQTGFRLILWDGQKPTTDSPIGRFLPNDLDKLERGTLLIRSAQGVPGDSLLLYASDPVDLKRLVERVLGQSFHSLKFILNEELRVERVAVFSSPAMEKHTPNWGSNGNKLFEEIRHFGFDESDRIARDDIKRAYLVDRSTDLNALPTEIRTWLDELTTSPATLVAAKKLDSKGQEVVILSGPDTRLTRNLAAWFPKVKDVPEKAYQKEALDLRDMKAAVVVVGSRADTNRLPLDLSFSIPKTFGKRLPFDLPVAGSVDGKLQSNVTFDELGTMKLANPPKYIWHVQIDNVQGETRFEGRHQALESYGSFSVSEPSKPNKPNRKDYDDELEWEKAEQRYYRRLREYEDEHDEWERAKRWHENERPVRWKLSVDQIESATAYVTVRLVEMTDAGPKVLWKHSTSANASERSQETATEFTVHGVNNSPGGIAVPATIPGASTEVVNKAVDQIVSEAMNRMLSQSWLPS